MLKTAARIFSSSWFFCALAFSLSLALLPFQYFPTGDGVVYAMVGKNIWSGHGIVSAAGEPYVNHPPFFPFVIGFLDIFMRNLQLAGHLASSLAFALTLLPLLSLARSAYGEATRIWVAVLYITNGFLLVYSNLIIADFLFIFLIVSEIWFIYRANALGLGIAGGLACLTRPEGFFYFAMGLLALGKQRWRMALVAVPVFLALAGPYWWYVHEVTQVWQLSGMAGTHVVRRFLELAHPGHYRDIEQMYAGLAAGHRHFLLEEWADGFQPWPYLLAHGGAMIKSLLPSAVARLGELSQYLYLGLGYLLIGAGWLASPWSAERKKFEKLLFLFLLLFLPYLMLQFVPRYFLVLFPILILWMGNGIEACRQRWGSQALAWGLCGVLALGSAYYVGRCLRASDPPRHYQEMGLWMSKNIPGISSARTAAQDPYVNFFSGSKLLALPHVHRIEDLLAFLRHRGAKYFVIGEDLYAPLSGCYAFLARANSRAPLPAGIALRHVGGTKKKVFLYEVL